MTSIQLLILSSTSLAFLTLMNIMQKKQFCKLFKDYLEYKKQWLVDRHNWDRYNDRSSVKASLGTSYLLSGSILLAIFIACYFSSIFNKFPIHELWYIAPLIIAVINFYFSRYLLSKWNCTVKSYEDGFCDDGRPFHTEILDTFFPVIFFFYVPLYITSLFIVIYTIKHNLDFFTIPEIKMIGIILVILIAFLLFIKSWAKKS